MEIQDLRQEIRRDDADIFTYTWQLTLRSDLTTFLSIEQQRNAILTLSRITGVSPEAIKLIDIVVDNKKLDVELSLAGAAHLLALHQLDHPALRRQGIVTIAAQHMTGDLEQAIQLDKKMLLEESSPKDVESLTTFEASASLARLNITLDDNTLIRMHYEHTLAMRDIKVRRLQILELRQARQGISCDPSVIMEIQDLQQELRQLDAQIAQYAQMTNLANRTTLLNATQQRAAVLALSRIAGVPPESIRLVDIVLGSVVMIVELPLAGAARLLALQQLGHPALQREGIVGVMLESLPDDTDYTAKHRLDRAVAYERIVLESTTSIIETPSPYAGQPGRARLRVRLAAAPPLP